MRKYFALLYYYSLRHFGNAALSDVSITEKHYQRATTYHDLGEFEQAIAAYKKAIAIDPNSPIIYNKLGVAYSELKQYDAALDAYRKALERCPPIDS